MSNVIEQSPLSLPLSGMDKHLRMIIQEGKALQNDYSQRQIRDDLIEDVFINGNFTNELYNALNPESKKSSQGKLIVNFVRTQVIDRATLLTMLPDPKWDTPFAAGQDSLVYQELLTQTGNTFWKLWNLNRQRHSIAFNLALKNRCPLMLLPDFDLKKPMLYVFDPSYFYGIQDERGNWKKVWLFYKKRAWDILAEWPNAPIDINDDGDQGVNTEAYSGRTQYEVCQYWDTKEKVVFVNNQLVPGTHFEHNLGFTPFQYIQDIHKPGTIDSTTSAYHAIALAESFTDMFQLMREEMVRRLKAIPVARGMKDYDDDDLARILSGDMFAQIDGSGDISFVSPVQNISNVAPMLGTNEDLFRTMTNFPRSRSGQVTGSINTGKSIIASQGAVSDDILRVREAMAEGLAWIDEKAIVMLKRFWGNQEHNILNFSGKSKVEGLTIIPNEDLPDSWEHELVVFALASDIMQKSILMIQLGNAGYLDKRTVIEQLPGFNPNEIMRRMEEDKKRELGWQMELQKIIMGAQAEAQAAQTASEENLAMEGGGMAAPPADPLAGMTGGGMVASPEPRNLGFVPKAPAVR